MGVCVHNGEIIIDQDGVDSERALLWATMLTDNEHMDALRAEYLGFELGEEGHMPLTRTEMAVVSDEVRLLMYASKHRDVSDGMYHVPVADDVILGQASGFMKTVELAPVDGSGLAY